MVIFCERSVEIVGTYCLITQVAMVPNSVQLDIKPLVVLPICCAPALNVSAVSFAWLAVPQSSPTRLEIDKRGFAGQPG